jgi:hypothetical protein
MAGSGPKNRVSVRYGQKPSQLNTTRHPIGHIFFHLFSQLDRGKEIAYNPQARRSDGYATKND